MRRPWSTGGCFEKPLDTEIVERERRLAADKGIGRLTLAVQYDSDKCEVVECKGKGTFHPRTSHEGPEGV